MSENPESTFVSRVQFRRALPHFNAEKQGFLTAPHSSKKQSLDREIIRFMNDKEGHSGEKKPSWDKIFTHEKLVFLKIYSWDKYFTHEKKNTHIFENSIFFKNEK